MCLWCAESNRQRQVAPAASPRARYDECSYSSRLRGDILSCQWLHSRDSEAPWEEILGTHHMLLVCLVMIWWFPSPGEKVVRTNIWMIEIDVAGFHLFSDGMWLKLEPLWSFFHLKKKSTLINFHVNPNHLYLIPGTNNTAFFSLFKSLLLSFLHYPQCQWFC